MSRPRYSWWPYVKSMIRKYPGRIGRNLTGVELREQEAVQAAVDATAAMENGEDRLKVIDMVLWRGTHQITGAALQLHVSERTAAEWHREFIRLTAKKFGCKSLLD